MVSENCTAHLRLDNSWQSDIIGPPFVQTHCSHALRFLCYRLLSALRSHAGSMLFSL
jgi:hypothetical protein